MHQKGQKTSQTINRHFGWYKKRHTQTRHCLHTETENKTQEINMVLYKRHKNVLLVEENISLHCLDSWALTWHALVDTCSEGVFTLMCSHAPAHQTSVNPSSHKVSLRSALRVKTDLCSCTLQYNNALLMTCTIKLGYTGWKWTYSVWVTHW